MSGEPPVGSSPPVGPSPGPPRRGSKGARTERTSGAARTAGSRTGRNKRLVDAVDGPARPALATGAIPHVLPRPGFELGRLLFGRKPETLLLALFLGILAVMHLRYGGTINPNKLTAKVPLVTMGLLVLVSLGVRLRQLLGRDSEARREVLRQTRWMVGDWLPFVLCVLVYENLHDTVKLIHADTLDGALAAMDEWLFGVQPTLWLQRVTTPWFTDYLAFAYGSYFFTPTILGGLLYYRKRFAEFRELMLATISTFYAGYLGYVLVPAIGPRHFLRELYNNPQNLQGIFLYSTTSALLDDLESVNRDCFPSLHTGISTITLIYAWRFRNIIPQGKLLFWIYLPLTVSLWFSTIYLRYHWVVDVFAGWALAALVAIVAPLVCAAWNERRDTLGLLPLGARRR